MKLPLIKVVEDIICNVDILSCNPVYTEGAQVCANKASLDLESAVHTRADIIYINW